MKGFRYSMPTVAESFDRAMHDGARRVIALSMSPFSTEVTTGAYKSACDALGSGETCPLFIPSWHDNPLFIEAWQERIFHGLKRYRETLRRHASVIFTSHSIPLRYVQAGDPYRKQIEETAQHHRPAHGAVTLVHRLAEQGRAGDGALARARGGDDPRHDRGGDRRASSCSRSPSASRAITWRRSTTSISCTAGTRRVWG